MPQEVLDTLFDVAMHTSTSRGLQHAGLIRVVDKHKRARIAEIATQPYIARAPELVIAIVDARRSARILEERGKDPAPAASSEVFREGFTDAVLMLQNIAVAAESLGLGITMLGSVLNDYAALIEVLELPEFTFPVLGLQFGYPGQDPQLKPRMPRALRVMVDGYQEPESWLAELKDYDAEMHTYYDLRDANRRVDAYTTQIASKVASFPAERGFVAAARAQGFDL